MRKTAENASSPDNLYVHVPYCRSKCVYCAFYSETSAPPQDYADCIMREYSLRGGVSGRGFRTVYIGGGTPSALGADGLAALCGTVNSICGKTRPEEWTVECNPGTLAAETASALRKGGVTRISIGAQSFDDQTLCRLGRAHSASDITLAFRNAKRAGFVSAGLDLIAGVPGVSAAEWRKTLESAAALDPDHVSVYALTVEDGTKLSQMVKSGSVKIPDDDEMMDALSAAEDFLRNAGYARYEISNYARPGGECLHNLAVWRGEDYLGLGPAASSRIGLLRRTNAADAVRWRDDVKSGRIPAADEENLALSADAAERSLTRLRLSEGMPAEGALADMFRGFSNEGIAEPCGEGLWRLTRRGREVADSVALEFAARMDR